MTRRSLVLFLLLAGCAENGLGLSVDLKTDFLPGRQFVGTTTEVFRVDGERQDLRDAVATSRDTFLEGTRVADFAGLQRGTYRVRVALLTPMGRVLATQESIVELREDLAVTLLVTSNCRDIVCPIAGGDAALTSCIGGDCVDPRCTPETPEFCGAAGCITDDQCSAGSECTTGACIDGFCFLRGDPSLCGVGFYCDIDEGCLREVSADGGVDACAASETSCGDGFDEDCDGMTDCADPDCNDLACDDDSVCTNNDRCVDGSCGGDVAMDCDDGNACTDDVCDAEMGCQNTDNTAPCDDGVWCNGADRCSAGTCEHSDPPCDEFCNESTMACEMCVGASDCGEVVAGPWGTCGGFSGPCDASGTETRMVMTPACNAGSCTVETTTESRACARATEGMSCGSTTNSSWGSCGSFANTCDETGTQSRTITTPVCRAEACANEMTMENRACNRDTDGTTCGTTTTGSYGACGGFSSTCDTTGTQSRSVTTFTCGSGSCQTNNGSQSRSCSRSTNGQSCGSTTFGAWGACGLFSGACDTTGTQQRVRTDRQCSASSCQATNTTESRSCTRSVSDGTSCGSFWQRCCSGSCTNLANNASACGACRVNCGALPCTADNGGYACSSCSFNSTCQGIYDGAATCYIAGGSRCNCQCPVNGVCADGGCGAGFYCHDIPGNNFCSPSP